MSEPVVQTIVEREDWKFVLEGQGDSTVVWPYHRQKPLEPAGAGTSHFRKALPYPSGYFRRSKRVIAWCERFAQNRLFREKELQDFSVNPPRAKDC
ncbi:MAG: hypothetical protein ACLFOY_06250 [Desulfatibacillaceae bacterium]